MKGGGKDGKRAGIQYFEGTPNSGMFYGQPDGVDAQGPGGAAGPAHDYGIPAGIHVGGAGISGAGSCPQKLSAGPPAAAALQRNSGTVGSAPHGPAGAGAFERYAAGRLKEILSSND